MKVLVVFASTEGQTARVAQFTVTWMTKADHSAVLVPAEAAEDVQIDAFDGVIVAGSVHAGQYQKSLVSWARDKAGDLSTKPTLFLSVSLSAAGDDPEDWVGLNACVERFCEKAGWRPGQVEHVAGAFKFSEYDFFRYWAMRWIAAQKDEVANPGEDREYTDWEALEKCLREWTQAQEAGK